LKKTLVRKPRQAARDHGMADSVTVLIQRPDGTEWARVEFQVALWKLIKAAAKSLGVGISDFFELALKASFAKKFNRLRRPLAAALAKGGVR